AATLLAIAMLGTGATLLLKAPAQDGPPPQAVGQPPPEAGPERAIARLGTTRFRHGDAVSFAACTPDGKALLTAGRDRTIRLWDLATGKEIRRFDWVRAQPDDQTERAADGITQRWERQAWDDLGLTIQAALSSDGKVVAASQGGVVCLWETATGKKL